MRILLVGHMFYRCQTGPHHCRDFLAMLSQRRCHMGYLEIFFATHEIIFLCTGKVPDLWPDLWLIQSKKMPAFTQAYRFVEYFSGESNVTWCLRHWGLHGLCFDSRFGGKFNNIFEPSGFASFGLILK